MNHVNRVVIIHDENHLNHAITLSAPNHDPFLITRTALAICANFSSYNRFDFRNGTAMLRGVFQIP